MADSFIRNEAGRCVHIKVDLVDTKPFHLVKVRVDGGLTTLSLKEAITLGRMLSEIPLPKLR